MSEISLPGLAPLRVGATAAFLPGQQKMSFPGAQPVAASTPAQDTVRLTVESLPEDFTPSDMVRPSEEALAGPQDTARQVQEQGKAVRSALYLPQGNPMEAIFASGARLSVHIPSQPLQGQGSVSQNLRMLMATLQRNDGTSETWEVRQDTLITEDATGQVLVRTFAEGDDLLGTENKDVLLALNNSGRVEGRGGDDLIIDLTGTRVILGGEGDDTIISMGANPLLRETQGRIEGGPGNDTIKVRGFAHIDAGDGNNVIEAQGSVELLGGGSILRAGDGNNTLRLATFGGTMTLGNGDNRMDIEELSGRIRVGNGDNVLTAVRVRPGADIHTGDGNNILRFEDVESVRIRTGAGRDVVDIGHIRGGSIDTGEGEDVLLLNGVAVDRLPDDLPEAETGAPGQDREREPADMSDRLDVTI